MRVALLPWVPESCRLPRYRLLLLVDCQFKFISCLYRLTMQSLLLPLFASMAAAAVCKRDSPPAFILAGDSTTAVQSSNGGGWGNGFLSFLTSSAWGINKGHNGATTVSFVSGGDWANVTGYVDSKTAEGYSAFVTIQFGHNDQVSILSPSSVDHPMAVMVKMGIDDAGNADPCHHTRKQQPTSRLRSTRRTCRTWRRRCKRTGARRCW